MMSIFRNFPKISAPVFRSFTTNQFALMKIFKVQTLDEFKEKVEVNSKDQVVIVDFFATWCGPCKMLTPRIEAVVGENEGKVSLAKVDVDDFSDLALDYEVAAVPVLVAIRNGKVEHRLTGLQDTDKLRTWVANAIKS